MKTVLKAAAMITGGGILFIGSSVSAAAFYNRAKLKEEVEFLTPPGKMVHVNNHKMHICSEGDGEKRLVFLSGGGTAAPSLDFKPLYSQFSHKYRTIVIERAGYGFSEAVPLPRDIDAVLEESRKALQEAGEKAPYVLFAHSMSGIEALYWAQKYPSEVEAIVGLDAAVPEIYEHFKLPSDNFSGIMKIAQKLGILRLILAATKPFDALNSEALTEREKRVYKAIYLNRPLTENMLAEVNSIRESSRKVAALPVPEKTPMYFFLSDGKAARMDNWRTVICNYLKKVDKSNWESSDGGHYMFNRNPEHIAMKSMEFIESLSN